MTKKLVVNCMTGKEEGFDLTAEELAEIPVYQAKAAELKEKMEREALIQAKIREMAIAELEKN